MALAIMLVIHEKSFALFLFGTRSCNKRIINIYRFVVDGFNHFANGRNLTSEAKIMHGGKNEIEIFQKGKFDYIAIKNRGSLNYIPLIAYKLLCEEIVLVRL